MRRASPALLALIALVWGPLLFAPLVSDDRIYLLLNPDLGGPWPGVWHFLTTPFGGDRNFEPLNSALHFALWAASGGRVWAFRVSSLLLHWADCVLVFALLRRLLKDARAALALAVLFAVFPPHHDVLGVSTAKKHLLVALFGLLQMVLVVPRAGRRWAPAAGAALLSAALLTRESALALPVLSWLVAEPAARRARAFWACQAAACAAFLVWRLGFLPLAPAGLAGGSWSAHFATSAKLLLWQVKQAVLPWPLCPESGLRPVSSLAEGAAVFCGVAGLSTFAWRLRRRDPVAAAGLAWFAASAAPFLNIAPSLDLSLAADRYLYLPVVGLLLAAGRLAARWPKSARLPAFAAVALGWSLLSLRQASLRTDALALSACGAACAPDNPRALATYGVELKAKGRLPEAQVQLERAAALSDELFFPTAAVALSEAYLEEGKLDAAESTARRAAERAPNGMTLGALGQILLRRGDARGADAALTRAAALAPDDGDALMALAALRASQGRASEAEALWLSAAQTRAYRGRALAEVGWLRLAQRRIDAAEDAFRAALAAEPYELRAREGLAEVLALRGRREDGLKLFDDLAARLDARGAARAAARVRAARDDYGRGGPR